MIADLIGIALISIGASVVFDGIVSRWRAPRGSGISSDMFEAMYMPEYERRARIYCVINGVHPREWGRFASRAIGEIIMEGR